MQRKSSILKGRKAFAMIMAIFFMILIATLLTSMLAMSTETAKRTSNTYLNEQAQLLAKSATEYTILRVSGHYRNGADKVVGGADDSCMNGYTASYPDATNPIFDIRVNVQYIGFLKHNDGGKCQSYIDTIQTAESNGTMLIDVYVSDNVGLGLTEPIRYHRRTLQKL